MSQHYFDSFRCRFSLMAPLIRLRFAAFFAAIFRRYAAIRMLFFDDTLLMLPQMPDADASASARYATRC